MDIISLIKFKNLSFWIYLFLYTMYRVCVFFILKFELWR